MRAFRAGSSTLFGGMRLKFFVDTARIDRNSTGLFSKQDISSLEFLSLFKLSLGMFDILQYWWNHLGLSLCPRSQVSLDRLADFIFGHLAIDSTTRHPTRLLQDFILSLQSATMTPETETELCYALFDSDRDDRISKSDFRELCIFYTGKIPEARALNKIWNSIDRPKRGLISKDQYFRWLIGTSSQLEERNTILRPSTALSGGSSSGSFGNHLWDMHKKRNLSVLDAFRRWKSRRDLGFHPRISPIYSFQVH